MRMLSAGSAAAPAELDPNGWPKEHFSSRRILGFAAGISLVAIVMVGLMAWNHDTERAEARTTGQDTALRDPVETRARLNDAQLPTFSSESKTVEQPRAANVAADNNRRELPLPPPRPRR